MDWYKKIFIIFMCLPLIFCGCPSLKHSRNKVQFYTLEYEPPSIAALEPLPSVIRIDRFSVAPLYNTNRIIFRDGSFKRDAYVYFKWRANPGDLVSHFLGRDIKQSGLFKAVLPHNSRLTYSSLLEGSVHEFFEWDEEKQWNAILSLSVTLMVENEPDISKRILFQKTYRTRKACNQKHPRALAEAMSRAMAEVSGKIIMDVYSCLKDQKRETLGQIILRCGKKADSPMIVRSFSILSSAPGIVIEKHGPEDR